MTHIIAYTYEADIHCVDCAKERFGKVIVTTGSRLDGNWIPKDQKDVQGNPIHPVFSTDELHLPTYCGDCGAEIVPPPKPGEESDELSTVDYLRDLANRLMRVPVMYGTDQYDYDRLLEIARELEGGKP